MVDHYPRVRGFLIASIMLAGGCQNVENEKRDVAV